MTVIILAAGLSERMGENKMLLPFSSSTILETTLCTALSFSESVIVVTGHEKERIEKILSSYPVSLVFSPNYKKGQSYSAKSGIERTRGDFCVVPGDLPLLLQSDYEKGEKELERFSVVRAYYNNSPGHPVFFKAFHKEKILSSPLSMLDYVSAFEVGKYRASIGSVLDADTKEGYKTLLSLTRS